MEREIMLTGIGGQGVQLAAQVLARAAMAEDREVMLLGTYGGTMRGGSTDSTLVVADAPIEAPPIVSRTWAVIAMHHRFWGPASEKLRAGGVLVTNGDLFDAPLEREDVRVHAVAADTLAGEAGNPMGASLVLAAAFASLTGLVGIDALVEGMRESVPVYRQKHIEGNVRALRAGFDAVEAGAAPAWQRAEGAA